MGQIVDERDRHGTFRDVIAEGKSVGFDLVRKDVVRDWGDVEVDIGLIVMRRKDAPGQSGAGHGGAFAEPVTGERQIGTSPYDCDRRGGQDQQAGERSPGVGLRDEGMSERAPGPWLVVVGMHRSGTSAVTGAIGALGFNMVRANDRLSPHDSNPEHWESLSILLHNDAILAHFGGTWDAPPQLPEGWETTAGLPDRSEALELLAAAYPDPGPSVWKDPRVCLLLPYWREVLHAPMAAVLVWRDPIAVARSLRHRDGSPIPYGVSLWERYNRSALANLPDTDVYVLDYDAMVDDPAESLTGLSTWLTSIGTFEGIEPWDHEGALTAVTANLRHESVRNDGPRRSHSSGRTTQLIAHLSGLAGGHRTLARPPGDESPWTSAILDARRASNVLGLRQLERRLAHTEGEREWFESALEESRSNLASLKASTSWRVTAPIRSAAALWTARRDRRREGVDRRLSGQSGEAERGRRDHGTDTSLTTGPVAVSFHPSGECTRGQRLSIRCDRRLIDQLVIGVLSVSACRDKKGACWQIDLRSPDAALPSRRHAASACRRR